MLVQNAADAPVGFVSQSEAPGRHPLLIVAPVQQPREPVLPKVADGVFFGEIASARADVLHHFQGQGFRGDGDTAHDGLDHADELVAGGDQLQ